MPYNQLKIKISSLVKESVNTEKTLFKICEILKSKAKQHGLVPKFCSALIMGASFKENVKDIRNSKSIDLYKKLSLILNYVEIFDPIVEAENKIEDLFFSINVRLIEFKNFWFKDEVRNISFNKVPLPGPNSTRLKLVLIFSSQ